MTINVLQDQLYPLDAARAATSKLERIFEKAGAPENFTSIYFDGPHEFNATMQEKAFDWLDEKLTRRKTNRAHASRSTIENYDKTVILSDGPRLRLGEARKNIPVRQHHTTLEIGIAIGIGTKMGSAKCFRSRSRERSRFRG
jgi:hypothetical protein